jgi:DNA-binding Lrp family transcriptional regulator
MDKIINLYKKYILMPDELDNTDKRILYELDLNARIPETQLAKRIRRSREAVRYRIRELTRKGIIKGYSLWINVSKLGYQGYKVYLKIGGSKEEQAAFFDHIRSREDVFWLGVADGAWDVGLTFFARNSEEFYKKKNGLFAQFSGIILDKKIGILSDVHIHPKKFLGGQAREPVIMFGPVVPNGTDDIERKILTELLENSRIRLVELATNVGATLEVTRNRMQALERKGAILRYNAIIDYGKLGLEFYKTFLYFDNLSDANERKLLEYCRQHPNILHVVRQISPWDVELEIMVPNYGAYNRIMHELRDLFPHELANIESAIMSQDWILPAKKAAFD